MRSGLDEVARSDERVASARELAPIRHLCKGYLVLFYQIKIAARLLLCEDYCGTRGAWGTVSCLAELKWRDEKMTKDVKLGEDVTISPVNLVDVPEIVEIDAAVTGTSKADFWYAHYLRQSTDRSALLFVARRDGQVIGYILGSIQAWEFGSPPCGWIQAVAVRPEHRHLQVASRLFEASITYFREHSIDLIRTMVHIDAQSLIAFFRMQGMAAGPYIELEMRAD